MAITDDAGNFCRQYSQKSISDIQWNIFLRVDLHDSSITDSISLFINSI